MAASLFAKWERNRGAELFILERWRVPERDMIALMELQGYSVRRRRDGSVMTSGKQTRLTSLLKAIDSFGEVCYAGQPAIAERMGCDNNSVKTVYRATEDALLLGVLEEVRSPYRTNGIRIAFRRLFDWTESFIINERGEALPAVLLDVRASFDRTPSPVDRTPSPPTSDTLRGKCPTIRIETHHGNANETPMRSGDGVCKSASRGRGSGGWSQPLTRYMLANVEQLETLFSEAQIRGWIKREPAEELHAVKLKFFTLAAYCVRKSRPELAGSDQFIEAAGAVFTKSLRAALAGNAKAWLGANEDEDTAQRLLLPIDRQAREADLIAEEDRRERLRDRDDALTRLKQWEQSR